MKRFVVFLAAAVAMPLALGDGSDCPGLADGELTGDCTITADLELAGNLSVPTGTTLVLQDAVLRFTDTENPSELVVSGTLVLQDSSIEVAEGVDLTIRFEPDARGTLEDSSMMGSLDVDEAARIEVYWSVRVIADLAVAGPAELTVRDAHDEVRATASLGHEEEELLLLLTQVQEGADIERLDPYRFILKSGSAANHAELEIGANQDVVLVLDDDDQDDPEWTTAPLRQDGARLGYSSDGSVVLEWEGADDTLGGDHPNRAVSHYRILLDGDEHVERIRGTGASIEDLPEGHHVFTVEAIDLVGNVATSNPVTVHVDKTPPTVDFAAEADDGGIEVTVTATETSEGSGLAFLRWRIGDGPTTIVAGDGGLELEDVVSLGPGNHSLVVITEDLAGHRVEEVQEFVMDTSAPTFLARLEPRLSAGAWHRQAPGLIVDVLDYGPSGQGSVEYRVGDGEWQEFDNSTILDTPGEHRVQVRVSDAADNEAVTQLRAAFDPDAPSIEADVAGLEGQSDWFLGPVELTASAADELSGIDGIEYRIAQGAWRPFTGSLELTSSGEHKVTLRATDAAANQALHVLTVSIDAELPTLPIVSWMAKEGQVQGDWSRAPPADGVSGVADIVVEREGAGHSVLDPGAKGHVMALPNGDHRLRVRVIDVAGNEAATPWGTVTVENSTVAAEGAKKVRGEVTLRPASVDGLVEARYFVDGILLDATATEPYAVSWQTRMLADGMHEVRVVAVDSDGLHHEELRTYNVRNGYMAVLVDEAIPAGLALVASTGALAVASVGFVRWRRWTL